MDWEKCWQFFVLICICWKLPNVKANSKYSASASIYEIGSYSFGTSKPSPLRARRKPTSRAPQNKSYRIHLVHGDLLHNAFAEADLRPAGIVDWECVAWMLEYWETRVVVARELRVYVALEGYSEGGIPEV
ncbi:hypothetical protein B0H14DRAFT_2610457 [Mycena olivaceomarginata]|nr:hypothetical protein B0H14DRAFT_2610457 [Mycena olivaceomarginata]